MRSKMAPSSLPHYILHVGDENAISRAHLRKAELLEQAMSPAVASE
jgi:hypothetical protein